MDERYQSEYELIQKTGERPLTPADLRETFTSLNVGPGSRIILHASLKRVGWIVGGARTVLETLMELIGPSGLLAMPSHSAEIGDPNDWENPPVPESWIPVIMETMPPYDPRWSAASRLGVVAELFRTLPGVYRSSHPQLSLAAWGRGAQELVSKHPLDFGTGDNSPYGGLYALNARILLFGVDFSNCSMLHLAEYRASWPGKELEESKIPVSRDGNRTQWGVMKDYSYDDDDFAAIGRAYEEGGGKGFARGNLGFGQVLAADSRPLVDFAVEWMGSHRRKPAAD